MKKRATGYASIWLALSFVMAIAVTVVLRIEDSAAHAQTRVPMASIEIDYPSDASIFPPEITPPTFIWRDPANTASRWTIQIDFGDGRNPIQIDSAGERMRIGDIDPRCVSSSNELPQLTPKQAAAHTWMPDAAMWEKIKSRSRNHAASVTISGFSQEQHGAAISRGRISITTSLDPVGAPIFYRDVPLIPSKSETGIIKPLAQRDLPLLAWRLRDVSQPKSRLLLTGMHTCANCHSFSMDGRVMGMDLDGPENDKGLYMLTSVKQQMSVTNRDVISWSSIGDKSSRASRIGFMSQVSPDGRYVITMLRGMKSELTNSYFVVNFRDYRFLQVFYPTRGILAWYDRSTGTKHPLPGADDPNYVQTNPVWSPDGKYIVFARAAAREPVLPEQKLPDHALGPEETQIKFDLYRVPFNEGRGGKAEPIEGASNNGMSNSFPKISPDGHWLVFVRSRNALLMRPDSELYIVPASGGAARRMECNTPLMNSWHSFSPNGRWLVFSSKSRSPYTQMFLTHLDSQGKASPAILIDNATAANRAVNIPEFVNIGSEGMIKIEVPAAESYRLYDLAAELTAKGELEPAIDAWRKVLELDPANAQAHMNLGLALQIRGDLAEGAQQLREARSLGSNVEVNESDYGVSFLYREQFRTAVRQSNCDDVVAFGTRLLEIAPGDEEVTKAIAACSKKQNEMPQRTK